MHQGPITVQYNIKLLMVESCTRRVLNIILLTRFYPGNFAGRKFTSERLVPCVCPDSLIVACYAMLASGHFHYTNQVDNC